jgi:hypothetical protein
MFFIQERPFKNVKANADKKELVYGIYIVFKN